MMTEKGSIIDHYTILLTLDADMGLYAAIDGKLGREVLLWKAQMADLPPLHIAQKRAQLDFPLLPRVLNIGGEDQVEYVVYDLRPESLKRTQDVTNFTPSQALRFVESYIELQQYVTKYGIVLDDAALWLDADYLPILPVFTSTTGANAAKLNLKNLNQLLGYVLRHNDEGRLPIPLEAFKHRAQQGRFEDVDTWLVAFREAVQQSKVNADTNPVFHPPEPRPLPKTSDTQPRMVQATSSVKGTQIPCAASALLLVTVLALLGSIALATAVFVDRQESQQTTVSTTAAYASATAVIIVNENPAIPTPVFTRQVSTPSTVVETPVALADDGNAGANIFTPTYTFAPPSPLPPTSTATLTQTWTPSFTPTVTLTPSATLTFTLTPTGTLTPSATPTATITPTSPFTAIPFPDGRRLQLYFDENSFYIYNPSNTELLTAQITLQSIDSAGNLTGNSFSGSLWAQFYRAVEPSKCVAIEITQSSPWLRPSVCSDYNAIITPQRSASTTFWLARAGTSAFRVLWQERVIGECSLQRGICDIYFP